MRKQAGVSRPQGRMRLRRAEKADCHMIHAWRNHPDVRRYFFNAEAVPLEEHEAWFERSLTRSDRVILVAHLEDAPVGVIRFDVDAAGRTAEIDIYVDPQQQGRGLGTRLLEAGGQWIEENTDVRTLKARVLGGNEASARMFKRCGYEVRVVHFEKAVGREGS